MLTLFHTFHPYPTTTRMQSAAPHTLLGKNEGTAEGLLPSSCALDKRSEDYAKPPSSIGQASWKAPILLHLA